MPKNIKKRGRPIKEKKENTLSGNEQTTMIQMSETPSVPQISIQDVQNQWNRIFGKYSNVDYSTFTTAWNKSYLNNPWIQNERIFKLSSTPVNISKDTLRKALENPQNSEQVFRQSSLYYYYTNYVYNSLIKLGRDIPNFRWYYTPEYVTAQDMKKLTFIKESQKVDRILKKFNCQLQFKTLAEQVQMEGKVATLIRKSYQNEKVDFFLLQRIPSDNWKITGLGSTNYYTVMFNMLMFLNPQNNVEFYPQFIQDIWWNMYNGGIISKDKKGSYHFNTKAEIPSDVILEISDNNYMYWVGIPQSECYVFGDSLATPLQAPTLLSMLESITSLNDYSWLQTNLLAKSVSTILTAEVPLSKEAKVGHDDTLVSPDGIMGFTNIFNEAVSSNVLPFFAPFTNFELHNIDNQPQNLNIVYNRLRDLIATSGNGALVSLGEKPSIASVKGAQKLRASNAHYLTLQFEQFLNNVLNEQFELKYNWKVTLWGDIYDDEGKQAKELLLSGITGMLPKVLSIHNMTLEDYRATNDYINSLGIILPSSNKLEATDNNSQKLPTKTGNPVGRPVIDDAEVENDSTATSKDNGNNTSDIKEFEKNSDDNFNEDIEQIKMEENRICVSCGKVLEDEETFLCDECLEEQYDNRLDNLQDNKIDDIDF